MSSTPATIAATSSPASYFPNATTGAAPDFVLRYDWSPKGPAGGNARTLLCLRNDDKSALTDADIAALRETVSGGSDIFDSTLPEQIALSRRKSLLEETLEMFLGYDMVVTDRFHGLIFATLTRRPVVALPTVDHKLTSAFNWFDGVPFARLAPTLDEVGGALEAVRAVEPGALPDWDGLHFDAIAEQVFKAGVR